VLQSEPALTGELSLEIDIAADGSVNGITTQPAAGAEGIAAVGKCAADVVKGWSFPARTVPGRTVLVYPFTFAPATAQAQ
jgi:hypothetical protein